MQTTRCSCGAKLPRSNSRATHRYIVSTPECWACYGVVLAREYEDPALFGAVHQLTVDAYAAQHPADQPPKSLLCHLVGLQAAIACGHDQTAAREALKAFVENRATFPMLAAPIDLGPLTVVDVADARTPQWHCDIVRRWASQVWLAWSDQHAAIAALRAGT